MSGCGENRRIWDKKGGPKTVFPAEVEASELCRKGAFGYNRPKFPGYLGKTKRIPHVGRSRDSFGGRALATEARSVRQHNSDE